MLRFSTPPGGAGSTTAVEVAAELGEVYVGCSGCGTVETEVSGCDRFPRLFYARERGEDLLFRSGRGRGEHWG